MAAVAEELATAVDRVVGTALSQLSVDQLQTHYAAVALQTQRLSGFGGAVLAELAARTGGSLPTEAGRSRPLPGWAAEASGDSPSAAGRLLQTGGALRSGLPKVAQAVLDGTVPFVRAQVLTRLVGRISPDALAEAEDDLIVTARLMDPTQLAHYVRHLLATWVEPVVEDQEAAATAARYLTTRRKADGSLWGSFLVPAGDAESLLTVIEPLARPAGKEDQRSAAQRRADALIEVCEQVLRFGQLPDAGGFRPQLSYVLPADWAARQSEEHTCPDCRRCPQHAPVTFADLVAAGVPQPRSPYPPPAAEPASDQNAAATAGTPARAASVPATHACATAAWTGPQTRARIETILCDARVTRVLLDRLGQVRSLESLSDSITPTQRRALAARDGHCAARGCTRPPAFCDAHHLLARADGGATTLPNLVLLCRRHHVLWHLGKITYYDLHAPWLTHATDTGPPGRPPPAVLSDQP